MSYITPVKDKSNDQVFPITHERAVRDDLGVTLESKLQSLQGTQDILSGDSIQLSSTPTQSTLQYTYNNNTYDFKIGDEVRIEDQSSSTGYTFYKLYDITDNGTNAVWKQVYNVTVSNRTAIFE